MTHHTHAFAIVWSPRGSACHSSYCAWNTLVLTKIDISMLSTSAAEIVASAKTAYAIPSLIRSLRTSHLSAMFHGLRVSSQFCSISASSLIPNCPYKWAKVIVREVPAAESAGYFGTPCWLVMLVLPRLLWPFFCLWCYSGATVGVVVAAATTVALHSSPVVVEFGSSPSLVAVFGSYGC